jgi:hypothetical protein
VNAVTKIDLISMARLSDHHKLNAACFWHVPISL